MSREDEAPGKERGFTAADFTPCYRGTSLIRNSVPPGPYSRNMPRAHGGPRGGGLVLMSDVPLHLTGLEASRHGLRAR